MKRYLVFGGSDYYPSGGVADLLYDTDDLTMVVLPEVFGPYMVEWVNILDTETGLEINMPKIDSRIIDACQKRDRLFHQYYVPPQQDVLPYEERVKAVDAARALADERARVQFFEELSKP